MITMVGIFNEKLLRGLGGTIDFIILYKSIKLYYTKVLL